MKYINSPKVTDQDIINFVSSILSNEYAIFNSKTPEFFDLKKFIQVSARDNNKITVCTNFNSGMSSYNIIEIDDYNVKSLYPFCMESYSGAWRNFLADRFPSYINDLKKYLEDVQTR